MAHHWIKNAIENKGGLHKHLGIPEGEKIPEERLMEAKNSKDPTVRREANLAVTLKGMHHGKKKHTGHSPREAQNALYGKKKT